MNLRRALIATRAPIVTRERAGRQKRNRATIGGCRAWATPPDCDRTANQSERARAARLGTPANPDGSGSPVENVEIDGEVARAMATFFNTPAGSSVSVAPAQLSRVTFSSVTTPGRTRVVTSQLPTGTHVPGGFTILENLTYDVATSASFSGSTADCFGVPWVTDPAWFSRVRILHGEGGLLVDRTILAGPLAPDFAARRVCADASSLDIFAVATRTIESEDNSEDRRGDGNDRDGRDKNDKTERKEKRDDKNEQNRNER